MVDIVCCVGVEVIIVKGVGKNVILNCMVDKFLGIWFLKFIVLKDGCKKWFFVGFKSSG